MRILFVSADAMECAGILRQCEQVRLCELPVDWARSARLGGHEVTLAANGAGMERAAGAVDAAVATLQFDAVASIGFCGALDETLAIGDVVVGSAVTGEGGGPCCEPDAHAKHRLGVIYSHSRIAQTAAEKRQLRATGAIAVEMEAAGVAERAKILGLPFYCVKAVTDLANEDLSVDFNAVLRPDGHFDKIGILRSILRHPSVRLPEVLRLRKRSVQAQEALGDFIANCRF
jgi:adenosylhomocysteine nucleosidase